MVVIPKYLTLSGALKVLLRSRSRQVSRRWKRWEHAWSGLLSDSCRRSESGVMNASSSVTAACKWGLP